MTLRRDWRNLRGAGLPARPSRVHTFQPVLIGERIAGCEADPREIDLHIVLAVGQHNRGYRIFGKVRQACGLPAI